MARQKPVKQETALDKREEVLELEMKARWWKAQHEIRFYTLAMEDIGPRYEEYLDRQQKAQEAAREEMKQNLIKAGLIDKDGKPIENPQPVEGDNSMAGVTVELKD